MWNLIFNRKKYKKPASLSLSNIKGFLQAHTRHFLDNVDLLKPPPHIKEQAIWRLGEVTKISPECIQNEDCKICGCNPLEAVWEDRACKNDIPCYPEMKSPLEWKYFKKDNNIT